jgi:hypothetical protein
VIISLSELIILLDAAVEMSQIRNPDRHLQAEYHQTYKNVGDRLSQFGVTVEMGPTYVKSK